MTKTHEITETPPAHLDLTLETWREVRISQHERRNFENKVGFQLQAMQKEVTEIHQLMTSASPVIEGFKTLPGDVAKISLSLGIVSEQLPKLVEKASQDRAGISTGNMLWIVLVLGAFFILKPLADVFVTYANSRLSTEFEGYGVKGSIKPGDVKP